MSQAHLSVRNLQESDIDLIAEYWLQADAAFMKGLGVDLAKLPSREEWQRMLQEQISQPLEQKQSYCLIWEANGAPVGHSNINKIIAGEQAFMHLHLWHGGNRQKGLGAALVRLTLPHFFEAYRLQKLYCEPYALNPAPNKTLERAGFEFLRTYTTTPGWINFEQPVNRWLMTRERLLEIAV